MTTIMKSEPTPPDREVLTGLAERVTYQNAENGFCVLRVKARGHRELVTLVGHAAAISAGEWITATGSWVNDRTHGQQFLFPLLTPGPKGGLGEAWSKWFGRYIRGLGIDNRASVFHSFRHSFKDALRAAGESENVNDALTGHSGGGVGRDYGAKQIVRRFGLPRLAEAIAMVSYPGLDLSVLQAPGLQH